MNETFGRGSLYCESLIRGREQYKYCTSLFPVSCSGGISMLYVEIVAGATRVPPQADDAREIGDRLLQDRAFAMMILGVTQQRFNLGFAGLQTGVVPLL
jgi:hypothetical protein